MEGVGRGLSVQAPLSHHFPIWSEYEFTYLKKQDHILIYMDLYNSGPVAVFHLWLLRLVRPVFKTACAFQLKSMILCEPRD